MSSNAPLIEFEKLLSSGHYIKAVDLACRLTALTSKKQFKEKLFGKKDPIFLKALRQSVKNKDELWLRRFLADENQPLKTPPWFTKIKDHPDWCTDARSRLLKAQILCAKQAILSSGIEPIGCLYLAKKTGFPAGFISELFQRLKEDKELHPIDQREIPALLEKGYDGQAVYLVIERVELNIPSEPYPHPIKMSNIPIHLESFQKAIVRAFKYVQRELLMSGDYTKENLPVFRWWVKPAPNEKEILALEGTSFYGAFAVGMLSLARQLNIFENTAITCDGNENGSVSEIGGLAQKCQAALMQGWNIIIAKDQNTEESDNDISNIPPFSLLRVKNVKGAMTYLRSGIGFEVVDYLNSIYERWGKLSRNEVPPDCPNETDFDELTKPIKVRLMGQNKNTSHDWDTFSKDIKRAVVFGWEQVGKTRLLRYEGRKISKKMALALKKGEFELKEVNIPILIQCAHLAYQLKGHSFEKAVNAISCRQDPSLQRDEETNTMLIFSIIYNVMGIGLLACLIYPVEAKTQTKLYGQTSR
jgi:hypothetical protein